MSKDKGRIEDSAAFAEQAAEQTMEAVHAAMANYFGWLRKMQSATPLGESNINKTLLKYAEQNVDAAFRFAQKLGQAKTWQEVIEIQNEFTNTQLNAFGGQVKELGAAYTEIAGGIDKTRFPKPTD